VTEIFLGLGSNIQRDKNLCAGLNALADFLTDLHGSPVFESEAVGYKGEHFYNLVIQAQTDLPLLELSQRLKAIEANNGRYAPNRQGLPLDIDILLYGDTVSSEHGIVLPRAEILKNAFVLWPLALLAPNYIHPEQKQCFATLWQAMPKKQRLWPVAFSWRSIALTPVDLLAGKIGNTTF